MIHHPAIMVYYHCYEVLKDASKHDARKFLGYQQVFRQLLTHSNSYHRNFGLTLLANITAHSDTVDFSAFAHAYVQCLHDPKFMTAQCCLENLNHIIVHRPEYTRDIVEEVLDDQHFRHYTTKQQAVIRSDVMAMLHTAYLNGVHQQRILAYIAEQRTSQSPKTRRLAKELHTMISPTTGIDEAARLETVRTRLYLLGYLRTDSRRGEKDRTLEIAIQHFQGHAGLTIDGFVGEETWAALEDLLGLSGVPDLARWAAGDATSGLLRRAVGVRLEALGLLPRRTWSKHTIWRGLRAFTRAAAHLRLTEAPLKTTISLETPQALETLAVLFDHDLLQERLAAYEGSLTDGLSDEDAALVSRFVARVAET
jgi:hypothetical protein